MASTGPDPDRPRRALVFSGGGARGAYEAGVLRYLVEELPRRLGHAPRLDILCGTSVGAIHACYAAATAHQGPQRGGRLYDVWASMRVDQILPISMRDVLRLPRGLLGLRRAAQALRSGAPPDRIYGLIDTTNLEKLVLGAIPWRRIRPNVREGHLDAVCVAATQIATGHVVVFVESRERELPGWSRDPSVVPRMTRISPHHALASAAIPLLFPAVRIGSTYYADGGLRLNIPLAPALRMGADRVLVVSLRQETTVAHEAILSEHRVEDYASPAFLFGKVLNALLLDHLDSDLSRMRRMNELLEYGEKAFGAEFLEQVNELADAQGDQRFKWIDELVIRPSADLGVLAGQMLDSLPESKSPLLRLAARSIGGGTSYEADLLSYLLFDGAFLAPAAELGMADARRREDDLVRFFTD